MEYKPIPQKTMEKEGMDACHNRPDSLYSEWEEGKIKNRREGLKRGIK
jgi:hypothetical protein